MPDSARWLADRQILIVEDDALVAMGLVPYLEQQGATVMWATNIGEAFDCIDRCPKIDVAIVDINLDGEISSPIVDRLIRMRVHTILCTGYEASSIEARFQGIPRSEKPFTRAKIRHLVEAGL